MKLSINIELDTDMKWFTDRKWYTKVAIVLVALFVILLVYEKCDDEHNYGTEYTPVAEAAMPAEESSVTSEFNKQFPTAEEIKADVEKIKKESE